jgi:hypothetical protein
MSTQIQFQAGKPQTFKATRSFALGTSGITVQQGDELMFDGTHVTYSGLNPVLFPQLRGAIKTGWVVPAGQYDPNDFSASIPRPAGVQVRNARGGNPMDNPTRAPIVTADAEEQEVGNVAAHAKATKDRNNQRPGQRTASTVSVEPQEGIPVRQLATPTKHTTNLEHTSASEAIRQAESVKVQPGQGRSREELMASMSNEERLEYQAQIDARKSSYVDTSTPVVGRVAAPQTQQKEGFVITNQVGGGVETFDASGTDGKNEESVVEVEGLRFSNTNVGRPKPPSAAKPNGNGSTDSRRKIAKSICPDFPDNYVFEDSAKKKIARLQADYEDRPDVIRAVAAAETDNDVRSRLLEEFPGAFA